MECGIATNPLEGSPGRHGRLAIVKPELTRQWQRFESLTEARRTLGMTSCIYVQADRDGTAVRVARPQEAYTPGTGEVQAGQSMRPCTSRATSFTPLQLTNSASTTSKQHSSGTIARPSATTGPWPPAA